MPFLNYILQSALLKFLGTLKDSSEIKSWINFSKVRGTIDWKDADWYKISSSGTKCIMFVKK